MKTKSVVRIVKRLILQTHAATPRFLSQLDMNNRHTSDSNVVFENINRRKRRLKKRLIVLACCLASTALAQLGGGYLGPAILSSGATGVGNRSGQVMDLRFFVYVDAVYTSDLDLATVNSQGQLVKIGGLYGADANIGVYGTHSWKRAQLGVDYRGTFREYVNGSSYSGIDQYLTLGYSVQPTRRIT